MAPERIAPYILAGGLSSRMGRDKAMIELGGKTLLARAVDTLRMVQLPGTDSDPVIVTVIGQRALLEGADRAITDSYPGCGPLGGIEAALNDLNKALTPEWALFLPVDMPFLPAGLIDALLSEWLEAGRQGAMACHVVVGNRPQPLVSLVHRLLHPYISDALRAGQFRVTPVLQSACNSMASLHAGAVLSSGQRLCQTVFNEDQDLPIQKVWNLSEPQRRSRHLWFTNINTQEDLREAETFLSSLGSISQ